MQNLMNKTLIRGEHSRQYGANFLIFHFSTPFFIAFFNTIIHTVQVEIQKFNLDFSLNFI